MSDRIRAAADFRLSDTDTDSDVFIVSHVEYRDRVTFALRA